MGVAVASGMGVVGEMGGRELYGRFDSLAV